MQLSKKEQGVFAQFWPVDKTAIPIVCKKLGYRRTNGYIDMNRFYRRHYLYTTQHR